GKGFDVIGSVPGKGTASGVTKYSFTDFNPLSGTSYYRLRQVDFNGDYIDSDVRAVNISFRKSPLLVSVFQEESAVVLSIYSEISSNAEFFITNTEGKKKVISSFLLKEGENKLRLPVHLAKGI